MHLVGSENTWLSDGVVKDVPDGPPKKERGHYKAQGFLTKCNPRVLLIVSH